MTRMLLQSKYKQLSIEPPANMPQTSLQRSG